MIAHYISPTSLLCSSSSTYLDVDVLTTTVPFTITYSEENSPKGSDDSLLFTYYKYLNKISFVPSSGPKTGGTLIKIFGLNDIIASLKRSGVELNPIVQIESLSLPVNLTSSETIFFSAPPLVENINIDTSVNVSIFLSLNGGLDFFRSSYTYYVNPQITEVIPSVVTEGDEVRIIGSNFSSRKKSICKFGDTKISVKFVSNTEVRCHVPYSNNYNNFVAISISSNGLDYSNSYSVRVLLEPRIFSINKLITPLRGGLNITMKGTNFPMTNFIRLKMNGVFAEDIKTDCTNHTCCVFTSLPHSNVTRENYAFIEQTNDGINYINSGWRLDYLLPMYLSRLGHYQGSPQGGFEVNIIGLNIFPKIEHHCIISHENKKFKKVVAKVINETHLSCTTPPAFYYSRNQSSFPVIIKILRLAEEYSVNSLKFIYTGNHELTHLVPSVISEVGESKLTIFGRNFDKIKKFCLFICQNGERKFEPAYVRSTEAVQCSAPHMAIGISILYITSNPSQIEGQNGLKISVVESNYTTSNISYQDDKPRLNSKNKAVLVSSTPSYSVIENIGAELNNITITEVYSTSGPSIGGTPLHWIGYNFHGGLSLTCKFGANKIVNAVVKNQSAIECISPSQRFDMWKEKLDTLQLTTTLIIRSNNSYHIVKSINFEYYREEFIRHVQPILGPASGNTLIRIMGTGFREKSSLSCKFGNATVKARYINDTSIECLTPTAINSFGSEKVFFSSTNNGLARTKLYTANNGIDFLSSDFDITFYTYYIDPEISYIEPDHGSYQTKVEVQFASNIPSTNSIYCRFADKVVLARLSSSKSIICIVPKFDIINAQSDSSKQLSVSFNNEDYTKQSFMFRYIDRPTLFSVIPNYGRVDGGNEVIFVGANFGSSSSTGLSCLFGEKKVQAFRISREKVICKAPSSVQGSMLVDIAWNNDNSTLSSNQSLNDVLYTYLPEAKILVTNPRSGALHGTNVTVFGQNFPSVPGLSCIFEDVLVPATWISHNKLYCISPENRFNQKKTVSLNIGINSTAGTYSLISSPGAQFSYDVQDRTKDLITLEELRIKTSLEKTWIDYSNVVMPTVLHALPNHGSINGGIPVLLHIDFSSVNEVQIWYEKLFCVFGSKMVHAEWLNSTVLSCMSPMHVDGLVSVTIKKYVNTGDFLQAESRATFLFIKELVLNSVSPNMIPASITSVLIPLNKTRGLLVSGNDFIESFSYQCQFKILLPSLLDSNQNRHIMISSSAFFHNSTCIECMNLPTLDSFYSSTNSAWATNRTLISLAKISVQISSNFVDWTLPYHFHFAVDHVITSLNPRSGPCKGGTKIIVYGENFISTEETSCRFGDLPPIKAENVTSKWMICESPSNVECNEKSLMDLDVTNNGFHYSSSNLMFAYNEVILESIHPSFGPHTGTIMNLTFIDSSCGQNSSLRIPNNFTYYTDPICKFDDKIVGAKYLTQNVATCNGKNVILLIMKFMSLKISKFVRF